MRVEKVDDEPAYGEIPGTTAYQLRQADAVPDEVEVVPDGQRSRSQSRVRLEDVPHIPGVPKIVAEKIDPDTPAYGDVPGTAAYELRKADAKPDEIVRSPGTTTPPPDPWNGKFPFPHPSAPSERLTDQESPTRKSYSSPVKGQSVEGSVDAVIVQSDTGDSDDREVDSGDDEDQEDEGFGDDFDDFEEGQEGDDFGEFDDGFQGEESHPESHPTPPVAVPLPTFVSHLNRDAQCRKSILSNHLLMASRTANSRLHRSRQPRCHPGSVTSLHCHVISKIRRNHAHDTAATYATNIHFRSQLIAIYSTDRAAPTSASELVTVAHPPLVPRFTWRSG